MNSVNRIFEQVIAGLLVLAAVAIATSAWRSFPTLTEKYNGAWSAGWLLGAHLLMLAIALICTGTLVSAVPTLFEDDIAAGVIFLGFFIIGGVSAIGFPAYQSAVLVFWPDQPLLFADRYQWMLD